MRIGPDLLEDFARGAAFLGTGGGGDPSTSGAWLRSTRSSNSARPS